ncbi:MAG: hypothetical protein FWG50_10445 [Kiritimatiellaeota bacterium]|nr:hypothetical protein [Kiritimatiellota bacterium]
MNGDGSGDRRGRRVILDRINRIIFDRINRIIFDRIDRIVLDRIDRMTFNHNGHNGFHDRHKNSVHCAFYCVHCGERADDFFDRINRISQDYLLLITYYLSRCGSAALREVKETEDENDEDSYGMDDDVRVAGDGRGGGDAVCVAEGG